MKAICLLGCHAFCSFAEFFPPLSFYTPAKSSKPAVAGKPQSKTFEFVKKYFI
jgi:hypothetical protein